MTLAENQYACSIKNKIQKSYNVDSTVSIYKDFHEFIINMDKTKFHACGLYSGRIYKKPMRNQPIYKGDDNRVRSAQSPPVQSASKRGADLIAQIVSRQFKLLSSHRTLESNSIQKKSNGKELECFLHRNRNYSVSCTENGEETIISNICLLLNII